MRGEARDAALLWDMLQAARLILDFTRGVDERESSAAANSSSRWNGP